MKSNLKIAVALIICVAGMSCNNNQNKEKLKTFKDPKPAREVSLIYPKNELKIHIIDALKTTIQGVVRGAIAFSDVEIVSPK